MGREVCYRRIFILLVPSNPGFDRRQWTSKRETH